MRINIQAEGSSRSGTTAVETSSQRFLLISFSHPIKMKLGQNNFLIWRKQVLSLIKGYRLQNFLFGFIPPPMKFLFVEDDILGHVTPEFLDWEQQDQLIMS